jgi:hypothetical protein
MYKNRKNAIETILEYWDLPICYENKYLPNTSSNLWLQGQQVLGHGNVPRATQASCTPT